MQVSGPAFTLCRYSRHSPAFFSAFMTYLRTFLTMLFLMPATLITTLFTNLCTNTANFFCPAAAHAHQLRRRIANSRALHIKLNAPGHHLNVVFLCA
jgi:hypothetical protein